MRPAQLVLRLLFRIRRKARRSRLALMLYLFILGGLLIAPFYIIYKPPTILINYFQHRWPDVLWHVPTTKRIIALTIDDGPSQYSDEISQILKANGATATFFVIGSQIPGREQALQNLIRSGNELANHAMNDEPSKSLSDAELREQIKTVQSQIQNAYDDAGVHVPQNYYFRPGSGFFSERMRKVVKELNYRLVLGSIYPHDPQIPFWRVNAKHILSKLHPGGIIICHDRRSWTAPMLREILPEMKRRGYQVVTITELLREEVD